MLFVVSDVIEGIQKRLAEFIGVDDRHLPTLRLLDPRDMKKYVYGEDPDQITTDSLTKFVEEFKKGMLTPFMRSQEIPTSSLDNVRTLVGKNFKQEVMDSDKDVVVFFLTPWCMQCKKLATGWKQLASELKDVKDFVVAKIDTSTNEIENLDLRTYPAIKLYLKG